MKMRLSGRNNLFFGICLVFLFVTASLLSVNAQITNVTARDPRINYVGNWVDQDNGGHKFTGATGSSLSFTFQGSSILWYSSKDPKGGVASVYVDQENLDIIDASVGTETNDNPILEVLFSRTNLDSSKEHTFNITYVGPGALGGPYVTIFLLAFSTSESTTTSATPNADSSSLSLEISKTTSTVVEVAQTSTKRSLTTSRSSVPSTSSLSTTTPSGSSPSLLSTSPISSLYELPTTSTAGVGSVALSSSLVVPLPTSSSSPSSEAATAALQAAQHMNLILGVVLGPIGGLLLLGAITLLIVLYRRRKNTFPPERDMSYVNDARAAPMCTRTGFGSKMGTSRPLFTPGIRAAGFTHLESSAQSVGRSTSAPVINEITGYVGERSSISDIGSSPPRYSAS